MDDKHDNPPPWSGSVYAAYDYTKQAWFEQTACVIDELFQFIEEPARKNLAVTIFWQTEMFRWRRTREYARKHDSGHLSHIKKLRIAVAALMEAHKLLNDVDSDDVASEYFFRAALTQARLEFAEVYLLDATGMVEHEDIKRKLDNAIYSTDAPLSYLTRLFDELPALGSDAYVVIETAATQSALDRASIMSHDLAIMASRLDALITEAPTKAGRNKDNLGREFIQTISRVIVYYCGHQFVIGSSENGRFMRLIKTLFEASGGAVISDGALEKKVRAALEKK